MFRGGPLSKRKIPESCRLTIYRFSDVTALEPNPALNDGKGKRKLSVKKKSTPVKRTKVSSSEQPVNDIPARIERRVQQPTPNEGSVDANGGASTECDDLVKEESQSPPASHPEVIYAHPREDGEFRLTIHGGFQC